MFALMFQLPCVDTATIEDVLRPEPPDQTITQNIPTLLDAARSAEDSSVSGRFWLQTPAFLCNISMVRCVLQQPANWHRHTSYWTTSKEQDFGAKMAAVWYYRGQSVGAYKEWHDERQYASWQRTGLIVIRRLWLRVETRRFGPSSKEQQSVWMLPESRGTFSASTTGRKLLFFMSVPSLVDSPTSGLKTHSHVRIELYDCFCPVLGTIDCLQPVFTHW